LDPAQQQVRAHHRRGDPVRARAAPAVRRGNRRPRGAPGEPGGHLHGPCTRARARPRRHRGARFRGGRPMNPVLKSARARRARRWIERRQPFTNAQALWTYLFPTVLLLVVMMFMRGATVPGTGFSLGSRTLPSALGMGVAFGGLVTLASALVVERED